MCVTLVLTAANVPTVSTRLVHPPVRGNRGILHEQSASSMNDVDDAVVNVLGHMLLHMHPSRIIQVQSRCDVLLVQ